MISGSGARVAGHAVEPYAITWRVTCLSLLTVWSIVLAVYWPTAVSMVRKWYESGTFAHGFLVPPIVLYFAWHQRRAVLSRAPAPQAGAMALLALAGLAWLIGDLASVLVVQQAALVAIVETVLLVVVGTRATLALTFPLVFLWFAVPVGEFLTAPLQDFTAWFAVTALRLSGVPVLVEGRALTIPSGYWLVAEACSGVRYVIPSIALGLLFARLTYRSWQRRVAFIVLTALVPVLANGVRAYAIIMLAHLTQNRLAVGIDHLIYGWVFFAVVMLLLFLAGGRWRESPAASSLAHEPIGSDDLSYGAARASLVAVLALAIAVLPALLSTTVFADNGTLVVARTAVPAVVPPWSMASGPAWAPHYVGADSELAQAYESGKRKVDLYIAQYVHERQGAELINSENREDDGKHWVLIGEEEVQVRIGARPLTVRQELVRSRTGQTRLAWTWYRVAGHHTLNQVVAKLLQVQSRILRRPYHAEAFVLTTEHEANSPGEDVLQDFLDHCPSLGERGSMQTVQ